MKLLLDKDKISLILSEYRDYIGCRKLDGIDSIIAGLAFLITVIFSNFENVKILQVILIVLAILYIIWGGYHFYQSIRLSGFNKDKLLDLLEDINEMEKHPHSIILIKDDYNENANRFLVYDDPRWHCKLFLNYHTVPGNDIANIENIQNHIKLELKAIPENGCFLFEQLHSKYSVSAKKDKTYLHRFYRFKVSGNDILKNDTFTIDGRTYHWMSIAEMEQDAAIMEHNSDIVSFVKQKANI